jgi:hypothetical protein
LNPKAKEAAEVLKHLQGIVVDADLGMIQAVIPMLKADVTQEEQDALGARVHEIIRKAVLDTALFITNISLDKE